MKKKVFNPNWDDIFKPPTENTVRTLADYLAKHTADGYEACLRVMYELPEKAELPDVSDPNHWAWRLFK